MLRTRLCPRCGCSHGSREGQPFSYSSVCSICQLELTAGAPKTTPPATPQPKTKPTKRKRGKR